MTRALLALACMTAVTAVAAETITLRLTSPAGGARANAICTGPASLLGDVAPGAWQAATREGARVPVQLDDLDGDGVADELVTVVDIPASGQTTVWVDTARPWTGADFADARVSWRYQHYAVLDTDRMAFGLYGTYAPLHFIGGLQWDLYAKRPDAWRLSLDELENIDYHSDNPVAVDILLVGNSVGLGGPMIGDSRPIAGDNAAHACRVLCNGPVRAGLEVTVTGWRTPPGGVYDVTIDYFVYAHHDFIDARFTLDQVPPGGEDFGLGIRRIPHPDVFISAAEDGVLGVMGQQEGIIGKTGLGLIFLPTQFLRWGVAPGEDDGYLVRLKADDGVCRAWLVGVWEYGGIADCDSFAQHLRDLGGRLGAPVTISR